MNRIQRLMKLHRLYKPAGEDGSDTGGTGTGDAGGNAGEAGAKTADEGAGGGEGAGSDEGTKGAKEGTAAGGDGKSTPPSDADAKLLKDVMKHKGRAQALEAELAAAKKRLDDFNGVDPVKARELLAAQEEAERKAAEARGEYDRLVSQMAERHKEDTKSLNTQLEAERTRSATLAQQIADLTVGNSFATSSFVLEDLTLTASKARVIYGAHFEFKDDKVVGYDKPVGASERTLLVDASGDPLGFNEALRALVEKDPDRDRLLRTRAKSGAGSSTTVKGAKAAIDMAERNATAKLKGSAKISAGLKALANKG